MQDYNQEGERLGESSDLQAGIWFGSMALSPIQLHSSMVCSSLSENVVFSAHEAMRNAAFNPST